MNFYLGRNTGLIPRKLMCSFIFNVAKCVHAYSAVHAYFALKIVLFIPQVLLFTVQIWKQHINCRDKACFMLNRNGTTTIRSYKNKHLSYLLKNQEYLLSYLFKTT